MHCCLDEILITFGFLTAWYKTLINDTLSLEEHQMIQSITDSLEKCWSKCEQDVFYAAVILNPFYKTSPFAQLDIFTNAAIYDMLSQLWKQFYQQEPPPALLTDLFDYLNNRGTYRSLPGFIAALNTDSTGKVSCQTKVRSSF